MKKSAAFALALLLSISATVAFSTVNLPTTIVGQLALPFQFESIADSYRVIYPFFDNQVIESSPEAIDQGDIAILSVNTDDDDQFTFIAVDDIPANTVITFTDNAWTTASGPFATTEGFVEWTHTSPIKAGTVVTITGAGTNWNTSITATFGTIVQKGGSPAFSATGDQIIAFADSWVNRPTSASDTRFLYALSTTGFISSGTTTANSSYLPSALSSSNTSFGSETDNQYFANGTTSQTTVSTVGTRASLSGLFTNGSSFWHRSDTRLTIPTYGITVLADEPSLASANPTFSDISSNQFTVNLSGGNGTNRLVVAKAIDPPSADPVDGMTYNANQSFGSGSAIGGGFVVFKGSASSFTVTGLTPGTSYVFNVYSFNGVDSLDPSSGFRENYKTTGGIGQASQTTSAVSAPEMNVKGNGVSIANGDVTPDAADHTDFGSTTTSGGTIVRTFTIENLGTANLNLTGTPRVVVGGTNPSDFSVTFDPTSPVAASGQTTVEITFDPASAGAHNATVSIANNDANENPYTFDIAGTGTVPADYSISTTGSAIVVTDVSGNGDTLNITEPGAGLIRFAAAGRTFSVDGGANISDNSGDLSRTGINSITVNGQGGDDFIDVGAFSGLQPLTVNGGVGNDGVNFSGNITFAAGASLDVDLQNDDVSPGRDVVGVAGDLILSGSGSVVIKTSLFISLSSGAVLRTVNGAITLEANQQASPTTFGNHGISVLGAEVQATGTGIVTLAGRGGTGSANHGVLVSGGSGSFVRGGTTAGVNTTIVTGTGGSGPGSVGVKVGDSGGTISSNGGNVSVTGFGGSAAGSNNYGVHVHTLGTITAGGNGDIAVQGTGGQNAVNNNSVGVVTEYGEIIGSVGASDVAVTGTSGPGLNGTGVWMFRSGFIQAAGGSVAVTGNSTGSDSGSNGILVGPRDLGEIIQIGAGANVDLDGNSTNGNGIQTSTTTEIQSFANGQITLNADKMSLAGLILAGSGTVTLAQQTNGRAIDLGAADSGTALGLTNAELGPITASVLNIGDTNSGPITVSAVITPTTYKTLALQKGASFSSTGGFSADVTSASVYERMSVNGPLAIDTSAALNVNAIGGFVPAAADSFLMIENKSGSSTTGNFSGKPEGTIVPVGGVNKAITYVGGTGSNDVMLNPVAAPTVTTNAATAIGATTATLNGSANPNGAGTTGWFRYSTVSPGTCNDSFGSRAPLGSGGSSLGSGGAPTAFSESVGSLTPATTYYFCAIAGNNHGNGFGSVLSFTTGPLSGSTLVVDTLDDSGPLANFDNCVTGTPNDCSLRGANSIALDGDTIVFDPTLFGPGASAAEVAPTMLELDGSDIEITDDISINGPGADKLVIDAGDGDNRVFTINGATVTISGVTLTGGTGSGTIGDGSGGAVYANGSLTLNAVHVVNNSTTFVPPFSGEAGETEGIVTCGGGGGGASFVGGPHNIVNSTFNLNTASAGGGVCLGAGGVLTIRNSTISGNTSTSLGGGVNNEGTLIVNNSTITANTAGSFGGGLSHASGTATLFSSIVAGNSALVNPEIYNTGGVASAGYNLVGDSSGDAAATNVAVVYLPTDILNTDPMLGALQNNGGPTPTRRPAFGSPVHDKGRNTFAYPTDQRGFGRTVDWPDATYPNATLGDGTDIGSVELLVATAAPASVSGRAVQTNGRGIANVVVRIMEANGVVIKETRTNSFGYFTLSEIPAGSSYIVSASAKRFQFEQDSFVVALQDNVDGIKFVGLRTSSQ